MSLSGFDEISEAVFEAGKSPAQKAEQERKRLENVYTPTLRVLSCFLLSGKVKLFLKVERERERESERERERERERELFLKVERERMLSLEIKM